ncbi:MAG: hypothetical protein AB2A00_38410 [Myxococcota bacterium]
MQRLAFCCLIASCTTGTGPGESPAPDAGAVQHESSAAPPCLLDASASGTLALDDAHNVWCWGSNNQNECARPSTTNFVAEPVMVQGIDGEVVDIHAGFQGNCARTSDGKLWCWGTVLQAVDGLEGLRSREADAIPRVVAERVRHAATGLNGVCVLHEEGTVRCWGEWTVGDGELVPELSDVVSLSFKSQHVCVLHETGDVSCWGRGDTHQLANGGVESAVPIRIDGIPPAVEVSVGNGHSCIRTGNGDVWCWGGVQFNRYGQAGGGLEGNPTPQRVAQGAVQLKAGMEHTCIIKAEGTPWCWGRNDDGQSSAGEGPEYVFTPTQVVADFDGVRVHTVGGGAHHECAMTDDNRVWCWGNNQGGTLGVGTQVRSPVPVLAHFRCHATGPL